MLDLLIKFHAQILDPGRFPAAMLALALVAVAGAAAGPLRGNANPVLWTLMDGLLGGIGSRLDRPGRKPADLITRGFIVTVIGLGAAGLIGTGAERIAARSPFYGVTEILLLVPVLTGGTVWYALLKLFTALKEKKVGQGSYYMVASSSHTDLAAADDYTITRIGMGYAARAFDKSVVAPVVWYLIAGLPGAYIYAGLAALAARFGRDGFTRGFGGVPGGLEMLMGFVPNIFAGLLMALAGLFTPTGGMTRAFRGLLSGKGRAPYAQGGWPVTAMAWSLDVSLGGPVTDLDGRSLPRAWTGPENATAQLDAGHLRRALYITLMAYLLFMASLMGAMIWAGWLFPGLSAS